MPNKELAYTKEMLIKEMRRIAALKTNNRERMNYLISLNEWLHLTSILLDREADNGISTEMEGKEQAEGDKVA